MLRENLYKTNIGVDTYAPDISSGNELHVKRLKNVQPSRDRWVMPTGMTLQQQITGLDDIIRTFAYYSEPFSQISHFYAITSSKVFVFNFVTAEFEVSPILTFLNTNDLPAWKAWLDSVYFTKRNIGLVKLQNSTATVVADAPGAKYLVIADSHLMLLNTTDTMGNSFPVRVQWSDLYAPESFAISPSSEADFYELSPDDNEGTGLSYQRGVTLIYTRNRIWTARYQKGNVDSLGRFQFDTLYNDVGNVYHGAQISVKEADYFIGKDNIYKLEGFQLSEIGDPIWAFFKETITNTNFQNTVVAINNTSLCEISWLYDHIDGYKWSIVYNYKENKWSDRDPDDVYALLNLDFPFRGYIPIEEVLNPINSYTLPTYAINGEWQYLNLATAKIFGGSEGKVYFPANPSSYLKADETPFSFEIETFEFDFDTIQEIKELDLLKLLFAKVRGQRSDSTLSLTVGTRQTQEDDVVWSAPILLKDQLPEDTTFFFRRDGTGHLIRFKLTWTNTEDWAVKEITKLGFSKLQLNANSAPTQ